MYGSTFETLPDEMVLAVLENLELVDLMKIIVALPNTRGKYFMF